MELDPYSMPNELVQRLRAGMPLPLYAITQASLLVRYGGAALLVGTHQVRDSRSGTVDEVVWLYGSSRETSLPGLD